MRNMGVGVQVWPPKVTFTGGAKLPMASLRGAYNGGNRGPTANSKQATNNARATGPFNVIRKGSTAPYRALVRFLAKRDQAWEAKNAIRRTNNAERKAKIERGLRDPNAGWNRH